ncbi:trypsin-like serine protease with C-terminal PDZ domain [Corynebacterium mustelae]|uniref:Trypsin-like serine protease with C-terminal PDZ domain n=1 Tax=Corynebacterium mustelae TaxID=571915 RepID=A0A0G3H2J7_9CORY|nr:trypsin-like peptidase domain-containing protein [Corynebacterium mustelae]AKK05337.1 trypsin-like serine protease with C-terminal PDZ domain [Corynebacterium mustelae]
MNTQPHNFGHDETRGFPQQWTQSQPQPQQQTAGGYQQSYNHISNPYTTQQPAEPLPKQEEEKSTQERTIGLVPAIALALVAAIGSGAITGVYVSKQSSVGNSRSSVVETLKQPVGNNGNAEDAGGVQAVASAVLPTVVSIQVLTRSESSEGSGSIISPDGYVLTNNHVVESAGQETAEITVTMNDGSTHSARFIAGDVNTDVAVIKIEGVADLPTISLGDSDGLAVGQQVVAIGSPLGLSSTVTSGIVSALNRPVRAGGGSSGETSLIDAIQTDAAINPGNSGGPLVDMSGALIGINSVIASNSVTPDSAGSIGLGFAIPANFARRVAQQLIERGQATQPMIGIQLSQNPRIHGAEIVEVSPNGPGDKAGLNSGEIVVGMNGRIIDSADALIAAVRSSDFGEKISLEVTDSEGNNSRMVEVTLTTE